MSNYTTQTAALKAVTIDTAKIDAKQIDTKKLFINGELFDPSQIKESPNQIMLMLVIAVSYLETGEPKTFAFMNEGEETLISGDFENNKIQFDLLELLTILYPDRNIETEALPSINFSCSNFFILHYNLNSDEIIEGVSLEPCILDLR